MYIYYSYNRILDFIFTWGNLCRQPVEQFHLPGVVVPLPEHIRYYNMGRQPVEQFHLPGVVVSLPEHIIYYSAGRQPVENFL